MKMKCRICGTVTEDEIYVKHGYCAGCQALIPPDQRETIVTREDDH